MTADDFLASVLSWHDFYTAVAAATAALLGLLFVAVSIRLSTSPASARREERSRAVNVFGNLIAVLVLALVMLIPHQDAKAVALQLGIVTAGSLARVIRRATEIRHRRSAPGTPWGALRRLGFAAFGVAMLAYAVYGLWTDGNAGYLYSLLAAVFVFLLAAADASWDLLLPDEAASTT